MELIDYLHVLRRRWVLMLIVILACIGGALAATTLQTKTYEATAQLVTNGDTKGVVGNETADQQIAAGRATAIAQIAGTSPAVDAAVSAASADGPLPAGASLSVSASADGTDPFVSVSVKSNSPEEAQAVANAYAGVMPEVLRTLGQAPGMENSAVVQLGTAGLPTAPVSPRPKVNLLVGLSVGIVLALIAAFVRESLDRRLRESDDIERQTKVSVLGVVPIENAKTRVPVATDPQSARAEAYRKIRTNLTFTTADGTPQSILITSAVSGEGKTTLAVNLAYAYAGTGQKVALVDADMRRPMIGTFMGLETKTGLSNVLAGEVSLRDALHDVDDGRIHVLTSGPTPANPSELLGSTRMRDAMLPLIDTHDVVIIDAPPVLPVADALVLAVRVEAVVLVAKVGQTTRQRLLNARDAVLKVQGNLVGIVSNAVVRGEDSTYGYAYGDRGSRNAAKEVTTSGAVDIAAPDPVGVSEAPEAAADSSSLRPATTTDADLLSALPLGASDDPPHPEAASGLNNGIPHETIALPPEVNGAATLLGADDRNSDRW